MIRRIFAALLCLVAMGQVALAQDNIMAGKKAYTLGEPKVWIHESGEEREFNTADLEKLTKEPANTSNIFLYPEGGFDNAKINSAANRAIGIQGFYVDMEQTQEVAFIKSTWEGASANAYSVYLTDEVPTLDILDTTPTYTATGLGQYTENTAVLPAGSMGRYLVFQPTDATNWGWGVKIRSISAFAPAEDVLTTFTVSPGIVAFNEATNLTFSFKNQNNMDIDASKVTVTASSNASLDGNQLTVTTGNKATLTAKMGDVELTVDIYAATVPPVPDASSIKTPIFTNAVTEHNSTVGFETGYNGGAVRNGLMTFPEGEVAYSFGNVRCFFFHNSVTTGAWNDNIRPNDEGYGSLHIEIFSSRDVAGRVEFEGVDGESPSITNHAAHFTLEAGKWTPIDVNLQDVNRLNNMSIRFDEANMCDILFTNAYFTDEQSAKGLYHFAIDTHSIGLDATKEVKISLLRADEPVDFPENVTNFTLTCDDAEAMEITPGDGVGVFNVKGLKLGKYKLSASAMIEDEHVEAFFDVAVTYHWANANNIAYGKPTYGRLKNEYDTSVDPVENHLPACTTDGDEDTYYTYDGVYEGGDAWIVVDLEDEYAITDVNVAFGVSDGSYRIYFGNGEVTMPQKDVVWSSDLSGWTATGALDRKANAVNYYRCKTPVRARYIAIVDAVNPHKPELKEIEVFGDLYAELKPTTVTLTVSDNHLVTGETVTFNAEVFDQKGRLMTDKVAAIYQKDASAPLVEEASFKPETTGNFTFYAKIDEIESEPVTISVIAKSENTVADPRHTVTLDDEKIEYDIFNNAIHFDINQNLKFYFSEEIGSISFDLIKLNWGNNYPSHYTVTAHYADGTDKVIYTEDGREYVANFSPVDRIIPTVQTSASGAPRRAGAVAPETSLENIAGLTITATDKGHGNQLTLNNIEAYGSQGSVLSISMVGEQADEAGPVDVYNVAGMMVRHQVALEDALKDLPAGVYIVNGKKYVKF